MGRSRIGHLTFRTPAFEVYVRNPRFAGPVIHYGRFSMQARTPCTAILAAPAFSAPAFAGESDSPAALRAQSLIEIHAADVQRANADAFVVRDVPIDRDEIGHAVAAASCAVGIN